MLISRISPWTKQLNTRDLDITENQLAAYRGGALIQDAFPQLSAPEREFLLTGYTAEDWAAMFPPEDDEVAECPACGGVLLRSQVDPADPYWYCTEDDCTWTGDPDEDEPA